VVRDFSKAKLLNALAITALIFIIGVLIGTHITNAKLESLTTMEDDFKTHALSVEMQYEILSEDPCNAVNSSTLTEELNSIAERLVFMENELGWDDKNVMRLKEYFSLLELRHWLLINKNNDICGKRLVPILYFYSNKGDCSKCEQQGFVLTNFKRNYPLVRIYHFDLNIDNPALDTVKKMYNVKYAPSIVFDGQTYHGFITKDQLSLLMGSFDNQESNDSTSDSLDGLNLKNESVFNEKQNETFN